MFYVDTVTLCFKKNNKKIWLRSREVEVQWEKNRSNRQPGLSPDLGPNSSFSILHVLFPSSLFVSRLSLGQGD